MHGYFLFSSLPIPLLFTPPFVSFTSSPFSIHSNFLFCLLQSLYCFLPFPLLFTSPSLYLQYLFLLFHFLFLLNKFLFHSLLLPVPFISLSVPSTSLSGLLSCTSCSIHSHFLFCSLRLCVQLSPISFFLYSQCHALSLSGSIFFPQLRNHSFRSLFSLLCSFPAPFCCGSLFTPPPSFLLPQLEV